jgi:hypothetical protein
MFGDRTWDRTGYLICIFQDRLSTDFEKLEGGPPPPHTHTHTLMCAPDIDVSQQGSMRLF